MNESPYAPPDLEGQTHVISAEDYSTGSLWIAYLIASPVAPIVGTITFFVFGLIALMLRPDDVGTPAGLLMVPLILMTAGIVVSYVLILMFGMSAVFILKGRGGLNGANLFWYGALLTTLLAVGFAILSFRAQAGGLPETERLAFMMGAMLATTTFFGASIMSTIGVFWFLVKRLNRKRLPIT
ncbi:MAG: hypothetical protein AAF497_21805 [Planctomycetota bacterium]